MANKLFVVSGGSGSGKSVTMEAVMGKEREVVSTTTRTPREQEIDGIHYHFISNSKFESIEMNDGFAEVTNYIGNGDSYGVTMEELENKLEKDHCFIVVDFNGMKQLLELYPYCVTIFITTDVLSAQKSMIDRGDKLSKVKTRVRSFNSEQDNKLFYDYVVPNDYGKMNKTIDVLRAIVKAETWKSSF